MCIVTSVVPVVQWFPLAALMPGRCGMESEHVATVVKDFVPPQCGFSLSLFCHYSCEGSSQSQPHSIMDVPTALFTPAAGTLRKATYFMRAGMWSPACDSRVRGALQLWASCLASLSGSTLTGSYLRHTITTHDRQVLRSDDAAWLSYMCVWNVYILLTHACTIAAAPASTGRLINIAASPPSAMAVAGMGGPASCC